MFIAAHCTILVKILHQSLKELKVVVGEHNYHVNGDGEEYFLIEKIIEVFHLTRQFCSKKFQLLKFVRNYFYNIIKK